MRRTILSTLALIALGWTSQNLPVPDPVPVERPQEKPRSRPRLTEMRFSDVVQLPLATRDPVVVPLPLAARDPHPNFVSDFLTKMESIVAGGR